MLRAPRSRCPLHRNRESRHHSFRFMSSNGMTRLRFVVDCGSVGDDCNFARDSRHIDKRTATQWRLPTGRESNDIVALFFGVIEVIGIISRFCPIRKRPDLHPHRSQIALCPFTASALLESDVARFVIEKTYGHISAVIHRSRKKTPSLLALKNHIQKSVRHRGLLPKLLFDLG
jgi:hypothetical protein